MANNFLLDANITGATVWFVIIIEKSYRDILYLCVKITNRPVRQYCLLQIV